MNRFKLFIREGIVGKAKLHDYLVGAGSVLELVPVQCSLSFKIQPSAMSALTADLNAVACDMLQAGWSGGDIGAVCELQNESASLTAQGAKKKRRSAYRARGNNVGRRWSKKRTYEHTI